MKKSNQVTLVLITAALASCNHYLTPASTNSAYYEQPDLNDSTAFEAENTDPFGYPDPFTQQWIFAFNPFAYTGCYGRPYTSHHVASIFRPPRTLRYFSRGIVRGGWGRSGHSVHS